jgi:hypothetical protein
MSLSSSFRPVSPVFISYFSLSSIPPPTFAVYGMRPLLPLQRSARRDPITVPRRALHCCGHAKATGGEAAPPLPVYASRLIAAKLRSFLQGFHRITQVAPNLCILFERWLKFSLKLTPVRNICVSQLIMPLEHVTSGWCNNNQQMNKVAPSWSTQTRLYVRKER